MSIIISPYARPLRNGATNAKNYPYWEELIRQMTEANLHTTQIGQQGEPLLATTEHRIGMSYNEIVSLIATCDAFVTIDSFLGHLGHFLGKRGIVIFGQSDPEIFGHKSNVNLLKSREHLRPHPWLWWEDVPYDPSVFVTPNVVMAEILRLPIAGSVVGR